MPKFFAGIGSRKTPKHVEDQMKEIGQILVKKHGFILRTGDAIGADKAFRECGALPYQMEVYTPDDHICGVAWALAEKFHPSWGSLGEKAKKLIARNTYQLFGRDFKVQSRFVVCWTPDGADGVMQETSRKSGGTGQAIRIAAAYQIPVFNLNGLEGDIFEHLLDYLE